MILALATKFLRLRFSWSRAQSEEGWQGNTRHSTWGKAYDNCRVEVSCGVVLLGAGVAHGVEPLTLVPGLHHHQGELLLLLAAQRGVRVFKISLTFLRDSWFRIHVDIETMRTEQRMFY